VVVNQACEHPDTPGKGELPQGYALRSANFISRDPDDPEKTCIAMVSHGHPGHDVPRWACKTAVNTMVPIQPFNFFYKVNQNVQRYRSELERRLDEIEMTPTRPGEPSRQPAGLAQLGYACFWPQGGGQQESDDRLQRHQRPQQPSHSSGFHDTVHDDRMAEKSMNNNRNYDDSENATPPPADRERTPIDTAVLVPSQ
jgi:hypothetical protein